MPHRPATGDHQRGYVGHHVPSRHSFLTPSFGPYIQVLLFESVLQLNIMIVPLPHRNGQLGHLIVPAPLSPPHMLSLGGPPA